MQFHEPSRNPQLILNAGSLLSQLKFILQQQVQRHKPIVWETAQAVHQLAIDRPELHKEHPMVQKFLKRFHQSRISTRLLYSHCHTLQEPLKLQHQIGIFSTHVDIDQIVQMAIEHAAHICIDEFGEVPPIVVEAQPVLPTFNIPSHIEYALFELLKNAMRATIERSKQTQIPIDELPITIRWYSTQHHTFVEIQDLGGGLPKRKNYFTFSYSTAPPPEKDMVMAGYGYGLPLSKLYCRYLGGELQLERLGEGTMAKISLKRDFQSEEAVL
ncbi:histidine kinase-like ATPase [Gorgonomyces haynaldii]|nr:histidine kinase-like ATPase [Gorgonomyces haynaldii]